MPSQRRPSRRPSTSRLMLSPRRPSRRRPLRPRQPRPAPAEPATAEPALAEPALAEPAKAEPAKAATCTGELADHRERLSRLHQEIIRGFRVVFRAAQRRSVARQGDVCSHRICEAGLRDLRCRVRRGSANSTASLPGKPSSPFKVWSARRGKRAASPERRTSLPRRSCTKTRGSGFPELFAISGDG